MKIFNWVHRRFNNKENATKNGDIAADNKQFLVENKSNVFECWGGGLLTIGTFGYDPLKEEREEINDVCNYLYEEDDELEMVSAEYESRDEISDSEEETENDDDDDDESPFVLAAYEEGLMEMKMEGSKREEFGFEYVMMEKKARTTLADLFYADSEHVKTDKPLKKGELIKEKSKYKHGVSLGKKLMLEEARPIHKLHQLIRRMLKRKIHPDINLVSSSKVPMVTMCDINDHASLLPTQDAMI